MKKIGITAMLIFVNIVAIILLINFRNKDESEMIESSIVNHSNDVSIMIQSSAGSTTYNRSSSETWPDSTKYHLNNTKSYCKNGSTYNLSGSKVLVNLKRADDCYFYFDLGANITFSMQLYQNNYSAPQPDLYTDSDYMAIINFPANKNISTVCVMNESNSSNCTWKSISGATTSGTTSTLRLTKPIPLSSGEGLKTLYAYVKDSSNNIYGYQSGSIIKDTTPPTCSINVTSSGISYSSSDNFRIYSEGFVREHGTDTNPSYELLAQDKANELKEGRYRLVITDGAGNRCEDLKEIVSRTYIPAQTIYAVTTSTCTCDGTRIYMSAGKTSVGATSCSTNTVICNQSHCGSTYTVSCGVAGSTPEQSYCPTGSNQIGSSNYCLKN